ncbi:hypothetical protein [Costertonia aggregata]|uniref:Uncharacterized protein n=1 Tax=Costertonia aggregata TaxID=343403 RepID=A0A7H9ARR4_9FLAO|nr:hypothetical protein [Costertonia aggregata]QLG46130.1 hypothetical protein HYG79_12485 [Costertonia aggregata]
MKKIFVLAVLLGFLIAIASCDYDDSNDIDIIIPNDTTQSSVAQKKLSL